MKKILNYFVMGAVAVMFSAALASCQKESANEKTSTPEAPEVHVIHVELDATVADTKATYSTASKEITIQSGDALYITLTEPTSAGWSGATGTLTYDGTSFKGEITYTGTYSGSDIITAAKDLTATFLPKEYDSVNYLSATGEATATKAFYAGAKDASVPQLVHLTATVSDKAGLAKTPLTLSAQNSVLCYSINANKLSAGAHTVSVSDGTTTISGSVTAVADAATTFAVAFPANATALTYTLSIAGYNDVAKSGKTLVAGKVVNIATDVEDATISGVFSVGPTTTVKFSKGNLQYQASTGTWRFAENQYDYVGNAAGNTTSSSRDTQSSWIDLFGWGTSGHLFASGYGASYQPWATSTTNTDYGPTDGTSDLTETYANGDWGVNMGSGWRTLTKDEWTYLFNTRSASTVNGTANARYAKAYLFGTTHGVIIFPDSYTHPVGVTAPTGINQTDITSWNANKYNSTDWGEMETAGAVFLPAAGYRNGTSVYNVGSLGYYWSSSPNGSSKANCLYFNIGTVDPAHDSSRGDGSSVRLVQDQ